MKKKCTFKGTEPSPKGKGYCARNLKVGKRMKGKDGNMWVVKKTKRGQYFQLTVTDGQYSLNCLWFHGISWVMEKFTEGDNIAIFGKSPIDSGSVVKVIFPPA